MTEQQKFKFRFEYLSYGRELMVEVDAVSLNHALILFAKNYHGVDVIYKITNL